MAKSATENIYSKLAERTGGDIYIGVVGPVRTGKSTFIKRFMELMVIPNIRDPWVSQRAQDELPQSAAGRTVMTAEPKFIPNEAVQITIGENMDLRVRMVDCVGYMVSGALGTQEGDQPRMISTPWSSEKIPFELAAELGTQKVIAEHSTIGVVITTDGSVTEFPRESYLEAEERAINEMLATGKPFVVVLNTDNPGSLEASRIKKSIESRYRVVVVPCNCAAMEAGDIDAMMEQLLYQFPIREVKVNFPLWINRLHSQHQLKASIYESIVQGFGRAERFADIGEVAEYIRGFQGVERVSIDKVEPGDGTVTITLEPYSHALYDCIREVTGFSISDDSQLFDTLQDLARVKQEYDRIESALYQAKTQGYGIVEPIAAEMRLEEPRLIKQNGKYGVNIRATAPSIHMIRCDVEAEIAPLVGTEKQSEELVSTLLSKYESDSEALWQSNIFGKSLYELVQEGFSGKMINLPANSREKLQETLETIINEGSSGLICIIL